MSAHSPSIRALIPLACAVAWALAACPPAERPSGYFDPPPLPDATSPPAEAPDSHTSAPDIASPTAPPDGAGAAKAGSESAAALPFPDRVPSFVGLFRELSPSVVNIYTQEVVQRRRPSTPLGQLPEEGTSLGSGMILDAEGFILTNAHVVENAAEIRVRFHDDTELPARLIGLDPVRDVALIKVDGAGDLRPVVPAASDQLEVGDWVVAIGNPLGLSHTMTKGIVSGKGRAEFISDRVGYLDLIQTDAPINQGSSGGPLFDIEGHVVGVNTALSAEGYGIAFAIPWEAVEDALPRLMQGGQVSRSWLGVYIAARRQEDGGGVLVSAVVDESPAARAGIEPGDIVIGLDGRPTKGVAEFRLRVASGVAGRELPLEVLREGKRLQLSVRLEEARDIR